MNFPRRKLTRLKDYNYNSAGYYFITICTKNKQKLFGKIAGGDTLNIPKMLFTDIGKIANDEILSIESHYNNIEIDKYVIMPNHIHIIIIE